MKIRRPVLPPEPRVSSGSDAWLKRLRPALRAAAREKKLSPSALERWAIHLFGATPAGILAERDPVELADLAAYSWSAFQSRRSAEPNLGVRDRDLILLQDDRPFLVRTLRELLRSRGFHPEILFHPIVSAVRDNTGRLVRMGKPGSGKGRDESLIICRLSEPASARLKSEIAVAMRDIARAVADFDLIQTMAAEAAAGLQMGGSPHASAERSEAAEFLSWLKDGSFVFLGAELRRVSWKGRQGSIETEAALGILASSKVSRRYPLNRLNDSERAGLENGPLLSISKSEATTCVYRSGRMDEIRVRQLDRQERVAFEFRFLGHISDRANHASKIEIPILRIKFARIREALRVVKGSFDDREIIRLFSDLPIDSLLMTSSGDLAREFQLGAGTLGADEVRVAARYDAARRGIVANLVMAQTRYRPSMREKIEAVGGALIGTKEIESRVLADSSEGGLVRIEAWFGTPKEFDDTSVLTSALVDAVRSWREHLAESLEARFGTRARALIERYADAFDASYQVIVAPSLAADDIADLETLGTSLRVRWGSPSSYLQSSYLKIFSPGRKLAISDVAPALVNFGFTIEEENAFVLRTTRGDVHLHIFRLSAPDCAPFASDERGILVAEAIQDALAGHLEHDALSGLMTRAGLGSREVDLLRTIRNYARQLGAVHARKSVNTTLLQHPDAARLLAERFAEKFDPARAKKRARGGAAVSRLQSCLAKITSLDDDRAIRVFANIIDAAVRTNYYREGSITIALKIDCSKIIRMPSPRPWREIYVYGGTSMEGCHLRGGPVARGGIRWSERPDDFRTEVLGLMKTQVTKNAQIVPTGAKGGFIVKRLPADRGLVLDEVRRCYRLLISSMLSIQDNLDLKTGRTIRPDNIVALDGDDPYLVVAADKGTATFSDTANALSEEFGFWLADAFASGGSNGYDHKIEGITARGAWVSVSRHFRALARDISKSAFTAVGVGDMSGDVFGNGLLLSRTIRLIAAFDHRDIFIDPNPDPVRSFRERERMFGLKRSSWQDYDRKTISKGGGIWSRATKSIPLSNETREVLGIEARAHDPDALIRAILTARVDLLYNGGIGTYVKASHELNTEVGDTQNDALRVDATQLRCRVVGEGGNLGFTQAARIEFARHGGRIFTDAMDNSAGVDLSDHEVNLKILIDSSGLAKSAKDRSRLIARFKEPVIRDVLADNYGQTLAVSLDEIRSRSGLGLFGRTMADLERRGLLNAALEGLPDADGLRDRAAIGAGLTTPELAVLLSYAKLDMKARLLDSPLIRRPEMGRFLRQYFAPEVRDHFGKAIDNHRLRDNLLVTVIANSVVNLHGATALFRLTSDLGLAASRVTESLLVSREVLGVDAILAGLFALDGRIPAERQYSEILRAEESVALGARWLVRNFRNLRGRLNEAIKSYGDLTERFRPILSDVLPDADRENYRADVEQSMAAGIPRELAERLVLLHHVPTLFDAVEISATARVPLAKATRLLYETGDMVRLGYLIGHLQGRPVGDDWDESAATDVIAELRRSRRRIVKRIFELRTTLKTYLAERHRSFSTLQAAVARLENEKPSTLAPYIVISSQIQNLAAL